MSSSACLGSFVGLAWAFDLLHAVRDLFSFSMSLMLSPVFEDFSFERGVLGWGMDVDFVRERAGMTMTVRVKEQE